MKILFVVNEGTDSGITVYAEMIAKQLKKRGVSVSVDSNFGGEYDLIHIHSCRPENIARLKLHQPRTPVVTSTHMTSGEVEGLVPDVALSMLEFGLNTFYVSCEKVFVTSPHIMRELQKNNLLSKKLVLLPYPFDEARFEKVTKKEVSDYSKKFGLNKGKKTVLCVASIQYRKGIFEFIETAKSMPEYNFVWVGKIPQVPYLKNRNEISELVEKNNCKNLFFIGALYGKELASAYSFCDLFWLPSFSETFGLVIIEAISFGKPVLMRNIPVKELFKGFVSTYSSNPKKIIKKILSEKGNKKNNEKELITKQKNLFKKFSIKKHVDLLIKEYEKVKRK